MRHWGYAHASPPIAALICALIGGACASDDDDLTQQGGDTTVDDRTFEAFTHAAANLTPDQRAMFQTGNSTFGFRWPVPVLGPLYNNDACSGCHPRNGRGVSQIGNGALLSQALIRISLQSGTPDVPGGDVPVPGLGLQLQDHGANVLPEVIVTLSWVESAVAYGDGDVEMLRAPALVIKRPNGALLAPEILVSYRQAPAVVGLGLLEAVSDDAILAAQDPDDADGDGISGRANLVWDDSQRATVVGRFGHKATTATLREQAASAFVNDIGLTNPVFPEDDGTRDITEQQLAGTALFVAAIAVPAAGKQNASARRGRARFGDFGCAACHTPTLFTGEHAVPALANQTIHPYSDLLLHDMGDGLSDGRRDFLADGAEWRTPPLWGVGLVQLVAPDATFLHDGRARSLAEAILWHGGEALAARDAFRLADRAERDALISFLQTL